MQWLFFKLFSFSFIIAFKLAEAGRNGYHIFLFQGCVVDDLVVICGVPKGITKDLKLNYNNL